YGAYGALLGNTATVLPFVRSRRHQLLLVAPILHMLCETHYFLLIEALGLYLGFISTIALAAWWRPYRRDVCKEDTTLVQLSVVPVSVSISAAQHIEGGSEMELPPSASYRLANTHDKSMRYLRIVSAVGGTMWLLTTIIFVSVRIGLFQSTAPIV
ncbi:MAG: hypothetical protein MHM6MM_008176, partial [Cercozoa sp. M6MM]